MSSDYVNKIAFHNPVSRLDFYAHGSHSGVDALYIYITGSIPLKKTVPAEEKKFTFCRICECACGMMVSMRGGVIEAIAPDRDHVVSRGFACKKGLHFHEIDQSPDRLLHPMKRTGSTWETITWRQALTEIGEKVRSIRKKYGPDSIAAYAGNGSGFSLPHAFGLQGFMLGVGSKSMYSASSQDCSNKFAVAERMYGTPALQTLPDFDNAGCFIMIGANPAASRLSFANAPGVLRRLSVAEAAGCRVYHVNPRRTETARIAGRHVFIRPGTDVFFLLAFAGELIRTGGVNRGRVERFMKNYDRFESAVIPWTPERAAEVTAVPAGTIREMVAAYRDASSAILYCSTGVNHGPDPALSFWLIEAINAASGNLDRRGGTLVGRGFIDLPRLSVKTGTLLSRLHSRIGGIRTVMDCFPGAVLPDEIMTPGDGQVRAIFVSGGNPMLSFPDTQRIENALEDLELLVCVDIFRNETGNLAHYLLPATSFFQHPDINFVFQSMMGIMNNPVVNYSDTIREPDAEQRDEFWIYRELARASGLNLYGSRTLRMILAAERILGKLPLACRMFRLTQEKIFSMILRTTIGISLRTMRKNPHGLLLDPLQGDSFLGKRVLTPDGRVDLGPAAYVDAAAKLESRFHEEMSLRGTIKLVNMRESLSHNSYYHNAGSCVGGRRMTNHLQLNPADAERAGLRDGDTAMVRSAAGSVRVPVKVTDEMMPGAAALAHGWGHGKADGLSVAREHAGVNVNYLTPSGPEWVDPLSGMARLTGIVIEVTKAG
jgi:anaerobic selenocysteine-containing dehydrogenase